MKLRGSIPVRYGITCWFCCSSQSHDSKTKMDQSLLKQIPEDNLISHTP